MLNKFSEEELYKHIHSVEKFSLYSVEAMALPLEDVGACEGKGQPKGLGKGKGKGKAVEKGKGKKGPLAILDGTVDEEEPEQTEEEVLKQTLKKGKESQRCCCLCTCLGKGQRFTVQAMQGKATAEGLIAYMSKLGAQFKNVSQAKKPWKSAAVKELLEE